MFENFFEILECSNCANSEYCEAASEDGYRLCYRFYTDKPVSKEELKKELGVLLNELVNKK